MPPKSSQQKRTRDQASSKSKQIKSNRSKRGRGDQDDIHDDDEGRPAKRPKSGSASAQTSGKKAEKTSANFSGQQMNNRHGEPAQFTSNPDKRRGQRVHRSADQDRPFASSRNSGASGALDSFLRQSQQKDAVQAAPSRNDQMQKAVGQTERSALGAKVPKQRRHRLSEPEVPVEPVAEGNGDAGNPSEQQEGSTEAPARRKRKPKAPAETTADPEAAGSDDADPEASPNVLIQEEVRNIPRTTVNSKWTPLEPSSVNLISSILDNAQKPILGQVQDTQKRREHALNACNMVSRRLRSKLLKGIPFPPPTMTGQGMGKRKAGMRDDELDFEKVYNASQVLEGQLGPLLDSIKVLEQVASEEEAALKKDYVQLKRLENNARSEAKSWRSQAKKLHPLVPVLPSAGDEEAEESKDALKMELRKSDGDDDDKPPFVGLEDDEELFKLVQQLSSHMESMSGNLAQLEGVDSAMARSKASLRHVLHEFLDERQYADVLFGS